MRPDHALRFPQLGRTIACRPDETLLSAARRSGLRILAACGGRGTCGACMVRVAEGRVHHLDEKHERGRDKWQRACRISPLSDCEIEIGPRSLAPVVRADPGDVEGQALHFAPMIETRTVSVAQATLHDAVADATRLGIEQAALGSLRTLPDILRDNDWSAKIVHNRDLVIATLPPSRAALGLAVDVGTTNMVGFLLDLEAGIELARVGIENPQTAWGGDVISRINAAARAPETAREMAKAQVEGLNAIAHDLCQTLGLHPSQIVDVAIACNTAIHHLLLGLPVRQLGRAPFVAAAAGAIDVPAAILGLSVAENANVHLLPNIGGFVGGDHVAVLLATRDEWSKPGVSVIMDIGTNTEISIVNEGAIISASSPSGPALEGGHISCGMRAADGAIERVEAIDGKIVIRTINDKPPVGICGSGVLDAPSALLAAGRINAAGALDKSHPAIIAGPDGPATLLAEGVGFSQADLRAIQLAKSAIRTALDLLLDECGQRTEAIDRFIIAGAFGMHVDIGSAVAIGLLPDLPRDRFVQVGNSAGLGVRRVLANAGDRDAATAISRAARYVELSSRSDFQRTFIKNIAFSRPERILS